MARKEKAATKGGWPGEYHELFSLEEALQEIKKGTLEALKGRLN